MMSDEQEIDRLRADNADLRARLAEAEKALSQGALTPPADHRQALLQLSALNMHLRLAMDAALAIAFEWDIATDRVRRLQSVEQALPETESDTFAGVANVVHPDDRDVFRNNVHAALQSTDGVYRNEFRMVRPDGDMRWLGESGRVEFDDQHRPVRLIGISQDITDRKRAEEKLGASESTLRTFYENSTFLMGVVEVPDDDSDIIHIYDNPATDKFFGYDPGSTPGKTALGLGVPQDVLKIWIAHYRDSERQHSPVRFEYEHPTTTGTLWLSSVVACIGPSGRGSTRFSYVTEDITERRQAVESLKEADRRKDEFLAMLAHELRNPLAPIRNAIQLLRVIAPGDSRVRGAHDMIERQVGHLVRLVDDLLDVSRVSRGKIQLQKGPLDIAAVVRQALETSRPLLDARHHELTTLFPAAPIHVFGDLTRLSQVLSNLLNNAAKYTDDGGRIQVTVERVMEGALSEAVIRVRDSGRGIDPKALDNLFDLFYQVDRNLDRSDGGLGIGLSLVKSLVEMHGGRVEAHSAGRGQGSEFVVRLPVLREEPRVPRADESTAPANATRGLSILVVDDNRDSAETMAMLLEMEGHQAMMAFDGKEAVEVALAERPAVVLLDIGLPQMNGYDACRAMRQGGLNDTLLVAMTGYGREEDRRLSHEVGFDAHLVKPVDLQAVRKLLESVVTGR